MVLFSSTLIYLLYFGLSATGKGTTISHKDPLIHYNGRWDSAPSTWWANSGFKIVVKDLRSLSLTLGPNTTFPHTTVGVSIDTGEYYNVNVTEGINDIPIRRGDSITLPVVGWETRVRINVEGWQNNRMNLVELGLNEEATLQPYKPSSRLAFQFIGDSLSAGQFLEKGVNQAWPFLVGDHLGAETRINAQPGATLTDMESYGNIHGVSFQYFQTEDTGFYYSPDHNYTTPWNFDKDTPPATHVVIHIGANDASHGVPEDDFIKTYLGFLESLRKIYPKQPFFIFSPWGWPHEDGSIDYYYGGVYEGIVKLRKSMGDTQTFLVNTTGWVTFDDVFPDNVHPHEAGMAKVAKLFEEWLILEEVL